VIALDTNILVYSHRAEAPFHKAAVTLVRGLAEAADPWALPWPCVHEFLANVTHPRIYRTPTPLARALQQVEQWLGSPSLELLSEDEGYWRVLERLLAASGIAGPRVHDARIAALCIGYGVSELWTADRDFGRFPELVARNPLVASK
jgi:uncharacterized protein